MRLQEIPIGEHLRHRVSERTRRAYPRLIDPDPVLSLAPPHGEHPAMDRLHFLCPIVVHPFREGGVVLIRRVGCGFAESILSVGSRIGGGALDHPGVASVSSEPFPYA